MAEHFEERVARLEELVPERAAAITEHFRAANAFLVETVGASEGRLAKRIGRLEVRFAGLERDMRAGFQAIDQRLDGLAAQLRMLIDRPMP